MRGVITLSRRLGLGDSSRRLAHSARSSHATDTPDAPHLSAPPHTERLHGRSRRLLDARSPAPHAMATTRTTSTDTARRAGVHPTITAITEAAQRHMTQDPARELTPPPQPARFGAFAFRLPKPAPHGRGGRDGRASGPMHRRPQRPAVTSVAVVGGAADVRWIHRSGMQARKLCDRSGGRRLMRLKT
jgi:hypothetical protein